MKIKSNFLFLLLMGITSSLFSQVTLTLKKPLSSKDEKEVREILKQFDPNSYSFSSGAQSKSMGKAKGLKSVYLSSARLANGATVASTNTHNNVFKASTNTHNNIFKQASTNTHNNIFVVGSKASTNTHNNVFKQASTNTHNNVFKEVDLERMDKLYLILSKYQ